MGRGAVVDAFSGASGDMLLGALVDAGVAIDALRDGLHSLPVAGWSIRAESASQHGLHGTRVTVRLDHEDHPHRGLSEVTDIVARGTNLSKEVKARATAVFERLAEAEARIHQTSTEEVEFHEVGAIDAIVDVVGVVLGFELLGVDWSAIGCSGLPLGSGWARSAHGRIPVPAPAALELVRAAGMPVRRAPIDDETGELTTPTGAALLTTLSKPDVTLTRVQKIGYGFGTREPAWPNAVRLLVGATAVAPDGLMNDTVVEIQTNLDDSSPEELGFAMERLLEAGALDVAFSPLQMKKNRPGVLLRVLASRVDGERLAELVLEHTSALGVRIQTIQRLIAQRREQTAHTRWGDVRVKVKILGHREIVAPEYEDCARIARDAGVTLREVYEAATSRLS